MRSWFRTDSDPQLTSSEVWGGNDIVDIMEVPGFMGWVHSKPLPPATEGGDVYCYLTVGFPRFGFADRPGGRGRPRTSHRCDRGYAPQFVEKTHEHSGSVGSPARDE
jgi:hypothetical protein